MVKKEHITQNTKGFCDNHEKLTKRTSFQTLPKILTYLKRTSLKLTDSIAKSLKVLSEGKTVDLAGFGKFEITERKAREGSIL